MILRGWKDICAAAGGISKNTARHLMREEKFPITIIAGSPMTTTEALNEWVRRKSCQDFSWPVEGHTGSPEVIHGQT